MISEQTGSSCMLLLFVLHIEFPSFTENGKPSQCDPLFWKNWGLLPSERKRVRMNLSITTNAHTLEHHEIKHSKTPALSFNVV
jgi:hypothetical protein